MIIVCVPVLLAFANEGMHGTIPTELGLLTNLGESVLLRGVLCNNALLPECQELE